MPRDKSPTGGVEPDVAGDGDGSGDAAGRNPLRLATAVMFVTELERSVTFYRELLGWTVTVRDDTAALLAGPDGFQLYVRSMGTNAHHPLGHVGIQYLMWTAADEADLRRCEQLLRAQDRYVSSHNGDGFSVVEGRGPDNVPVLITFPGPDQAPRHGIMKRIYEW
ncbi:VOC family protein [Jiangella muralis]|uniref:VOC family protein n=1 Tax=Jiangella muralis TaxID=702383 RepID=UPI000AE39003|nr:VOC family protein [Jiangella muralis]